jgi:signal peptidase II
MVNQKQNLLLLFAAALFLAIDQLTKFFIRKYMEAGQSIPLIQNVLHLTYRQNTGAGFSILQDQNLLLVFISLIALGFVIYYCLKSKDYVLRLLLSALSAGIIGNLIDRIFLGHVTDFIDIRIWPVFNVADSVITITVIGLIIYLWKK